MSDIGLNPHSSPAPKRRRARPGNTNALKLGFYSRQLGKLERLDFDAQGLPMPP